MMSVRLSVDRPEQENKDADSDLDQITVQQR